MEFENSTLMSNFSARTGERSRLAVAYCTDTEAERDDGRREDVSVNQPDLPHTQSMAMTLAPLQALLNLRAVSTPRAYLMVYLVPLST